MRRVKAWWGNLTGSNHDMIAGQRVELTGTIREASAITTDKPERQTKRFDVRKQAYGPYISS
jgi:uncharacterized protein YjbJ (UPF0337 family)